LIFCFDGVREREQLVNSLVDEFRISSSVNAGRGRSAVTFLGFLGWVCGEETSGSCEGFSTSLQKKLL